MRADPALTANAAGVMLDGASTLADLGPSLLSTMDVPADVFGTLAGSPGLAAAYRESSAALDRLVGRLGQLLEGDGDRLYQLAFAYRAAEYRAAQRIGAAGMRAAARVGS
jgi:hypothetical protein